MATTAEAGLEIVRAAPRDEGTVELIVRRPAVDEREVVDEAQLALEEGLIGDNWRALAGDQLYLDLDLSGDNLPPGTRLEIGSAVIEVTAEPHTGCKKFAARFGLEMLEVFNSPEGRALNLRGINTRVVQPGTVRVGDAVRRR